MPTSRSRKDPFAAFNFIITVENIRAGFSEVDGLGTSAGAVEANESAIGKIAGARRHMNISLKRGYTCDGTNLYAWCKTAVDGKPERKSGTITVLNEARQPAFTWEFSEAWPSKWVGPELNGKSNEVAIEEIEISVEGLSLRRVHLPCDE